MSALVLITVRHGLKEPEKVYSLQMRIVKYYTENYGDIQTRSSVISRILGKLPQLRTLSLEGMQRLECLERLKYLVPPTSSIR
jgi:hypothetical protein